jgi:hypothetical protein
VERGEGNEVGRGLCEGAPEYNSPTLGMPALG